MSSIAVNTVPWAAGLSYGLLALPLAFVAMPLYMALPSHYAQNFAVPLGLLGLALLLARLADALCDPWIGRWVDQVLMRSRKRVLQGCSEFGVGGVSVWPVLSLERIRAGVVVVFWRQLEFDLLVLELAEHHPSSVGDTTGLG